MTFSANQRPLRRSNQTHVSMKKTSKTIYADLFAARSFFCHFIAPNALEGELRLTNLSWDEQLADKDSDMYKELVAKLERELKDSLAGSNSDLNINIVGLQQGSVIIQYRYNFLESAWRNWN